MIHAKGLQPHLSHLVKQHNKSVMALQVQTFLGHNRFKWSKQGVYMLTSSGH